MSWLGKSNPLTRNKKDEDLSRDNPQKETDPLLAARPQRDEPTAVSASSSSWIRARGRSHSASPTSLIYQTATTANKYHNSMESKRLSAHESKAEEGTASAPATNYEALHDASRSLPPPPLRQRAEAGYEPSRPFPPRQQQHAPILEIPEETYAIRKSALQVLKPLTKTWIFISVGFSLTVLFGTARWTRLMPNVPYWFILFPCWSSHIGLLWLHILSARALSQFIAQANERRQRPDSRDHLNRTEYLPLLQRSLKFGFKTGLMSFILFVFEILVFFRLARHSISLGGVLVPIWLLVAGGILDGLVCRNQHFLRVVCWILACIAMVLAVCKVDYHYDALQWRVVLLPVVAILTIASVTLIYIVLGHQVGYYRLTESQLTAGNLYSLAALICIVLVVVIGEIIPQKRPVEVETRMFVVILAPLVVSLVGMGAWVVSRDEFARLLLYGGQSTVHPMRLKWEARGWTCVQGKGVTVIPMFGEVSFHPLERKATEHVFELCTCCAGSCYPYEDEDEEVVHLTEDLHYHPYLDPAQHLNTFTLV